ncbi:hypothetical protein [Algoriphagus sp. AGSA1]|nr:hypothetical protein [Algoriphagus sp. AGSA1]
MKKPTLVVGVTAFFDEAEFTEAEIQAVMGENVKRFILQHLKL